MRPLSYSPVALLAAAIFLQIASCSLAGPDLSKAIRTDPSLAPTPPTAPEVDWEEVTLFADVGNILSVAWESSYTQLLHRDTLTTIGVGAFATWAADANDDGWLRKLRSREYLTNDVMSIIGDETSLAMTALPAVTWWLANRNQDEKLRQYSLESLSGITLVYAETLFIAHLIPTHERPRDEDGDPANSFFDTAFRGNYSFPSGHLIAPLMLTMKTYDYYGWKAAAIPGTVAAVSAFNRIGDGSHYPSDVVAATVLSISAHLSTRRETTERDNGFHWGAAPVAGGGLMFTGSFEF